MEVMFVLASKLGWQDAPVGMEMSYEMGAIVEKQEEEYAHSRS